MSRVQGIRRAGAAIITALLLASGIAPQLSAAMTKPAGSTQSSMRTETAATIDGAVENTGITPTGIRQEDLEKTIDEAVAPFIGTSCAGAAVVIMKDGQTILSKGYGYADIEEKIPVDPARTTFEWGSVSKTFVWTAVMKLVEEGRLDLGASIAQYLPEDFIDKLNLRFAITMLDLMNHRAGFEEVYHDLILEKPAADMSLRTALENVIPRQCFAPDTVSAYSNYSCALAAYTVECITGQTFADYARMNFLDPLAMDMTSILPDRSDAPAVLTDAAQGYMREEDGTLTEGPASFVGLYPAGAMMGTAEDLASFGAALCAEDCPLFANDATRDEMFTESYSTCPEMAGCAHGFWPYKGVETAYGHGGNTLYFSSQLMVIPEENLSVVILTNQQYESQLIGAIGRTVFGSPEIAGSSGTTTELPDVTEFDGGLYVGARGGFTVAPFGLMSPLSMLRVEANDRGGIDLVSVIIPSDRYSFTQVSPGRFVADSEDSIAPQLYFVREGGVIRAISIGGDGDFVPFTSIEGMSTEKIYVSYILLMAVLLFCLISLPIYLIIAIVQQVRRSSENRQLTKPTRAVRFQARMLVMTTLLLYLNLGAFLWRVLEIGDMTKTTANLFAGGFILLAILFAAQCVRLVVLTARGGRDVKISVAIKAILTAIFTASPYVVLALWGFFAII